MFSINKLIVIMCLYNDPAAVDYLQWTENMPKSPEAKKRTVRNRLLTALSILNFVQWGIHVSDPIQTEVGEEKLASSITKESSPKVKWVHALGKNKLKHHAPPLAWRMRETASHILTECPAIARVRERHFGSCFLNPEDVKIIHPRKICAFAREVVIPG
ncbi:hypothetical protein NQ318_012277 [Aromia moschata]|uniref:Uncharacterized protein n=1 Tax=Aromia moschata TaxID=1265417 RepID=A0AAV8XGI8_9CUCU|nr:hypothetical protein NQ318_012277 [Aromia moschata]